MITMVSIFFAGMCAAFICIMIGFLMGKSVVFGKAEALPKAKLTNQGPVSEPEGDYFGDEMPDYSDPSKRVRTI